MLRRLLDDAERHTGVRPQRAVVSVPAYFDEAQREATATAARLAGLEGVRLIREPVAAALAYGMAAEEDQTVLVLDLGGGTYDVSLLEASPALSCLVPPFLHPFLSPATSRSR